ncbi:MAG: sigma-70 family RNA polymerase sigma factor [Bacteroidetes bacterium]|nr:sigma-70 family RNA polymerase sigma factor [Bacteroidota bacterium]
MMPENLQEIIRCVRNGDRTAFSKLVAMYQQPAFRLAFRILGNDEEARDAVQESFIKVWQKIGSFDPSREFIPWMYRILANTSTDHLRKIRRHTMIPIDQVMQNIEAMQQNGSATPADNHELAMLIKGLAGMLPEKQKLVFILRDIEGMASKEVESITDMTETSVKSNLYLARKKVREQLLRILEKERRIQ